MLEQPVTKLPQVGAERVKLLRNLGLETVHDVLFSFPRDYKDYSQVYSPDQVSAGQECLVYGKLSGLQEKYLDRNRRLIQGKILGLTGYVVVSWFTVMKSRGTSYLYRQLVGQKELWVYGQVKPGFYGLEIAGGEWHKSQPERCLVPVYPLVAGITNTMRLKWIKFALKYVSEVYECLPGAVLDQLMPRQIALQQIHFPRNDQLREQARERLVFEEFFLFHLALRKIDERGHSVQHQPDGALVKEFLAQLPFKLTAGQQQAITDVGQDMESPRQMRRLILGDVGSGKTVVAQYAALKAVGSQGQAAIMVPTEVLAKQMFKRMQASFEPLGINVALLIGKSSAKQQQEILTGLKSGDIPVVIGTHALITERVEFANLTLAVIDEQHRFGVRQRLALSDKGSADLLVMSATPIPRSLALTVYGDLNVTYIRELPSGRKPVDTRLIHPKQRLEVYRFLVERAHRGEQGFVIFPLVEESDKLEAKAAIQEMEFLSQGPLASVRVGLVHGQMGKEKDKIMEDFYRGALDVLISTTVIEVGMNVPTATVMVIEDAERFGLAQLHQLRGRVGRAQQQAYCFLIADPRSEIAKERLQVIRNTTDGFKIAEEDLKIRGPGDLLGTRQSGLPWFKLANLVEDQAILEQAAKFAQELISADPTLSRYPTLVQEMKRQRP